jgi:hypothetical protein
VDVVLVQDRATCSIGVAMPSPGVTEGVSEMLGDGDRGLRVIVGVDDGVRGVIDGVGEDDEAAGRPKAKITIEARMTRHPAGAARPCRLFARSR